MQRRKEIAKFLSGAEAFHAFTHGMLGWHGVDLTAFGFTQTLPWHVGGFVINALIAILLGVYAWRRPTAAR